MKKEGKAVIIVILLVFFIAAVSACGFFIIKLNYKEKEIQKIQEDLAQVKEDLNNNKKENNGDVSNVEDKVNIDVDSLNEKHSKTILKIKSAGSCEGKYLAIMGKEGTSNDYQDLEKNSSKTSKNSFSYIVTSNSYSEYEKTWQSFMSKSLFDEIVNFKGIVDSSNAIININEKVAINEAAWSGSELTFISQNLVSKENNVYTYEVKYRQLAKREPEEYEDKIAIVTGRIDGQNYIIESFVEK